MSEQQVEIFARKLKDLNVPMDIGADPNAFSQVKIATGNMPEGFSTFEGLYLIHIIQILSKISDKYFEPMQQEEFELRLAELMADFQAKADDIVAQGFYKTYAKEVDLLAQKPTVENLYAKAIDTAKVWFWQRTSAAEVTPVTGTWTDTGLSELDQAKIYADQGIKEYVTYQNYIGPVQVLRNGTIWELPAGQTANGTEPEAPGVDARWINKLVPRLYKNLDETFNTYATLDSVNQFDINRVYSRLLDDSIKKISLVGKDVDKYTFAHLRQFYLKKTSTGVTVNIIIALTNNTSDSDTANDIEFKLYGNPEHVPDSSGHIKVYSNSSIQQLELVLDVSKYQADIQYGFVQGSKKNGLMNISAFNYVEQKYCYANITDEVSPQRGNPFALARSLQNVTILGDFTNKKLQFTRLEKTASAVILDLTVNDYVLNTNVVLRKSYTHAEFTGLLNVSAWAVSGANSTRLNYGVAATIDAAYLNQHFKNRATWKILPIVATQPISNISYVTEIRLLDQYDFPSGGYCDYRGFYSETAGYRRMSAGVKIPEGAVSIKATGGFDKNANILFGDSTGRLIQYGYAWKDADGLTKYSGDEIKTSLEVAIPAGAHYLHMATLSANLATTTLNVIGDFKYTKKTDFKSIQEVLVDKTKPDGLYTAQKYMFRKNGNLINNVQVIDGTDLAKADTYSASALIKGSGFGQLVFYKNGKYYFYNGSTREIYIEENGVKTVLTNPSMHPVAWEFGINQGQGRTVLEVLDDDSILFCMLESIVGDQRYSLWKMKVGQVPKRCFIYSHDTYTDTTSAVKFANGCPLGEWSFSYARGLIFATEYGAGTSKWWYEYGESGGNGRGVSSKMWVSKDQGETWYLCLNLNELKDAAQGEADTNWKYFDSTYNKNMSHIHCVKYDSYADRIYVTNGDSVGMLISLSVDEIKNWLTTATPVVADAVLNPNIATGLNWNAVKLNSWQWHSNINYHCMRQQHTALYPIEKCLLMGHDAAREFMYIAHRDGILSESTLNIEPSYNWEFRSDFNAQWEFFDSQTRTDGFVMSMTRRNKTEPILIFHSASGKNCRVWATYNGVNHRKVFESELKEIQFGCRVFFDESGNILLSSGASASSNESGYFKLSIDRI
jgi:hypothetical protein